MCIHLFNPDLVYDHIFLIFNSGEEDNLRFYKKDIYEIFRHEITVDLDNDNS